MSIVFESEETRVEFEKRFYIITFQQLEIIFRMISEKDEYCIVLGEKLEFHYCPTFRVNNDFSISINCAERTLTAYKGRIEKEYRLSDGQIVSIKVLDEENEWFYTKYILDDDGNPVEIDIIDGGKHHKKYVRGIVSDEEYGSYSSEKGFNLVFKDEMFPLTALQKRCTYLLNLMNEFRGLIDKFSIDQF